MNISGVAWPGSRARDHRLLRYDSRGCGLSDRAIDNLSFETWIKDFEKVIDAAGFGRFSLVSTCWGGPVAIEYAARHPERVDRLVLYGTYARGRLRRSDQPKEVEKARVLLDLTRLGWGLENHAFLQVWASHFQPGGTIEHLRARGATSSARQLLPKWRYGCWGSVGASMWAKRRATSNAPFS